MKLPDSAPQSGAASIPLPPHALASCPSTSTPKHPPILPPSQDPTVDGTYACGYVATQGPLPSTVPDFWQAMRVAQCSAVVMLTNYVDFGHTK